MTSDLRLISNLTTLTPPSSATPTLVPWETEHLQVHTIVIVVIFCVVCFLLLVAFFYAFCFRCSLEPSAKDPGSARRSSLDREDATYGCSSSEGQSVANAV